MTSYDKRIRYCVVVVSFVVVAAAVQSKINGQNSFTTTSHRNTSLLHTDFGRTSKRRFGVFVFHASQASRKTRIPADPPPVTDDPARVRFAPRKVAPFSGNP